MDVARGRQKRSKKTTKISGSTQHFHAAYHVEVLDRKANSHNAQTIFGQTIRVGHIGIRPAAACSRFDPVFDTELEPGPEPHPEPKLIRPTAFLINAALRSSPRCFANIPALHHPD